MRIAVAPPPPVVTDMRAVDLPPQPVEPEAGLGLSLEAPVHVHLGVGRADEKDADRGHDAAEDAHRDEELHQAVAPLFAEEPDEQAPQCDLASTSASVRRAIFSL